MSGPLPPWDNPYAAPLEGSSTVSKAALDSRIVGEELSAFVGPNTEYYGNRWSSNQHRHLTASGFNFAAMFFSEWWFFYRRMYLEFAITFAALVLYGFLLLPLKSVVPAVWVDGILTTGLAWMLKIAVGAIGNELYFRRAQRMIGEARAEEHDLARRCELLRKKGGTNRIGVLLAIAAFAYHMFVTLSRIRPA